MASITRPAPDTTKPPPDFSAAAGFSFIEILVIAALLGILVLGVVPRLFAPDSLDIELAARQVAVDLGMARRLAIAEHANYVAAFNPGGGPYTSYTIGIQGGGAEPDFPKSFAAGVTVTGIDQIVFAPAGSATPAGTITISFAKGATTATVQIIAATGRVRVIGP